MPRCGACGRRLVDDQEFCAACTAARDDEASVGPGEEGAVSGEPMVQVARFSNAAEAGFFADELQDRLQISVSLQVEENFDALTGYWGNRMALLVPESAGSAAAMLLQEILEQTEEDGEALAPDAEALDGGSWTGTEFEVAEAGSPQSGINWVPIVLTLAAGSAAIWGVRKLNEAPRPNAGPVPVNGREEQLWNTLRMPHGGWMLNHDEIPGRRQLRIDGRRGLVVIQEDANGDGVYESELHLKPVEQ